MGLRDTSDPVSATRVGFPTSDQAFQAGDIAANAEYYCIHFATALRRSEQLDAVVARLRMGFTPEGMVTARAIEQRLYAQTWSARTRYDAVRRTNRALQWLIHEALANAGTLVLSARLVPYFLPGGGPAMKRLGLIIGIGALLLTAAGPTIAAGGEEVMIEVEVAIPDEGLAEGTFTATGPLCPSGQVADLSMDSAEPPNGDRLNLLVRREFTCENGSGTFVLLVRVHAEFEEPGVFVHPVPKTWSVLDGTGAFAKLHGAGEGLGEPTDEGFFDTMTGRVHLQVSR